MCLLHPDLPRPPFIPRPPINLNLTPTNFFEFSSSNSPSVLLKMPANIPTAALRILCEETQSQTPPQNPQHQHSPMTKTPRVASITLDYLLYIELKKHAHLSRSAGVSRVNWEKISPTTRLAPFEANIVAFTWPRFRTEAMIHVANDCDSLRRFLFESQDAGKLVWMANIRNHPNYGVAVKINGDLDFLNFSNAAYEAFPANIAFKITMDNPT
ncbi:hypothetical protein PGTUg99_031273 [Puccinia graminis f. sp. tritici]|uniref:Uncharacterized protein n=1 Tax=Puccinia graminis f. sp. tritici TaxID=56615 RepID=A0A5B0SEX8_PUCGR|nr:hypothetical protein PGTUg99_031273 [Puccinia graminis f. sp. tritici]